MKKALRILKNILVWAVALLAVGMMIFTVVSVRTFDRGDRSLFAVSYTHLTLPTKA